MVPKRLQNFSSIISLFRGEESVVFQTESVLKISLVNYIINEPQHRISNNVVCATTKPSDQPAHTRSLIRVFDSGLNNL